MVAPGIRTEFVDREFDSLTSELKLMGDKLEAPPEFRPVLQALDDRRVGCKISQGEKLHLV